MEKNITVDQIIWQDITIEVTYEPKKWTSSAHIQVKSIHPEKAPIPITETGYRSHFLPVGALEEHGITAKQMVLEWIEEESRSIKWKNHEKKARQLSLF